MRDILKNKPSLLVNCYSLKELDESIQFLFEKNYELIDAKEIVPNTFNLGLIKDIHVEKGTLKNLQLQKRFRYYFMFKPEEQGKSICITFNPECNVKSQVPVKLDSGVIKCSTLQVAISKLKGRNLESIKQIATEQGAMNYYELS